MKIFSSIISVLTFIMLVPSFVTAGHIHCIPGTEVVVSGGDFIPSKLSRNVTKETRIPVVFVRWLDEEHALFHISLAGFYATFEESLTRENVGFNRIISKNGNPMYFLTDFETYNINIDEIKSEQVVQQIFRITGIPVALRKSADDILITPNIMETVHLYMNSLRELSGGHVDKIYGLWCTNPGKGNRLHRGDEI